MACLRLGSGSGARTGASARRQARQSVCLGQLSQLGVALQLYATDFDRFPVRFSELYDEYLTDFKYFMAPGGKRAVNDKDDIDEKSDYAYASGLTPADLSNMIIAYSKKYVHEGRGLFVATRQGAA